MVTSPTDTALAEATMSSQRWRQSQAEVTEPEGETVHQTRDGTAIRMLGSCGSAGEADLANTFGMEGIGVFRTELQFLVDDSEPSEDALVESYREVVAGQKGKPVAFRLLDVAAATLRVVAPQPERNPSMGRRGVRGLLANQDVLRKQLRAVLRAAVDVQNVSVLVPFVTTLSDMQRMKAAVLEERVSLMKAKISCATNVAIAPIIEVPAAAIAIGAILNESDFAVVAIDDLQAHLLGADRDNVAVREYYEMVHPAVFEVLARMCKDANRRKKPLVLFGESAAEPMRVPFYIGVGYRSFSVAPVRLRGMLKVLARYSVDECRRIAARMLEAPRTLDVQKVLVNLDVE